VVRLIGCGVGSYAVLTLHEGQLSVARLNHGVVVLCSLMELMSVIVRYVTLCVNVNALCVRATCAM
jgi:hypothetical protein